VNQHQHTLRLGARLALLAIFLLSACNLLSRATSLPTAAPVLPSNTPTRQPATVAPATSPVPSLTPIPRLTSGADGVSGGIVLQNGGCCIGGIVNSTSNLRIDLPAASTGGTVMEMRLRLGGGGCAGEAEMEARPWQPYQPSLNHSLRIEAINWVGWYASVQYRDDQGRLSPVYCDDISVEGKPPPLT
jgi:hypothetical protein